MTPYISVVVPTTRVGGLDVLFAGLENQIFKEFELLLVDSLYEYRKDIIKEKSKNYSFQIKHLSQPNDACRYCKAMNIGVINSSGQIVYCVGDYTWLEPNCLQIHADFHKNEKPNKNCALLCPYYVCKMPKIHNEWNKAYAGTIPYAVNAEKLFIDQEADAHNKYIDDISRGLLNKFMWSIFDREFSISDNAKSLEITDTKELVYDGITNSKHCFLKNESYEIDNILDVNGFNEALDGSHGWQDIEFIDRVQATIGITLYSKSNISAINLNPRPIMYGRARARAVFSNETIWKAGIATNFQNKVNDWSLKDARTEILKG